MVSFDVSDVGSRTRFPDTQSAYVSASEYGGSVGIYAPGRPTTASLVDGEMNIDRTGGSTIVVWPRVLSRQHQRLVFTYANRHGWAILRGGKRNQYTTANLLIRETRSTDYPFGIDQVPCYFGTPENRMHQGETCRRSPAASTSPVPRTSARAHPKASPAP